MTNSVRWSGPITNCDICKTPIGFTFVDGKTHMGPWAIMCPKCFKICGVGLGLGRGQHYSRASDGCFYKTAVIDQG